MPFVPGTEVRDIPLDGAPNDIDLSNDGRYLAVAVHKGTPCVRVFTTADGTCVGEFGHGASTAYGVAFVEGGKSLCYLTWNAAHKATLWKVAVPSGKPVELKNLADEYQCKFLERDAEGTRVAVGGAAVRVYDLKTQKLLLRVICNVVGAEGCAHFADAKRIWVFGSEPSRLVLYHIDQGGKALARAEHQLEQLDAPASSGLQVIGSPDGRWLAGVGAGGRGVALYDLETHERIESDADEELVLDDKRKVSGAMAFSHDSKLALLVTPFVLSLGLPGRKVSSSDASLASAGDIALRSATALEAPLTAFGFYRGNKVVLVPTAGKTKTKKKRA